MPYIVKDERRVLNHALELLTTDLGDIGFSEGQVNYCITTLLVNFLGSNARYKDYNAAIGILECAKLELYRRQVADYEDEAIERNGDL